MQVERIEDMHEQLSICDLMTFDCCIMGNVFSCCYAFLIHLYFPSVTPLYFFGAPVQWFQGTTDISKLSMHTIALIKCLRVSHSNARERESKQFCTHLYLYPLSPGLAGGICTTAL